LHFAWRLSYNDFVDKWKGENHTTKEAAEAELKTLDRREQDDTDIEMLLIF